MIRLVLIVLAMFYIALPAIAASVQVRSGEHADFSRLTLSLPERVEWSVERVGDGAHVSLIGGSFDLDLRQIFERIPRDRITDARWNSPERRLELTFGCDCELEGFWFGEAMLVLDVAPRAPAVTDPPRASAESTDRSTRQSPASRALMLLTPFGVETVPAKSSFGFIPLASPDPTAVEQVRNRLLLQISRATSQGLLTRQRKFPAARLANTDQPPPDVGTSPPSNPSGIAPDPLANLHVNSRIDLDYLGARRMPYGAAPEDGCPADALIDVAAWGTDAPFGEQVAQLRPQLIGEFDVVNEDAARKLAGLYLYFGFGAEARGILSLLPSGDTRADLLFALADIAEHGFAPPGTRLANQLDCSSLAAFWSALSHRSLPQDAVMDSDAILRGFSALPPHLRRYYGPILSRRFLDAGHADLASRILRIMDRALQAMSSEGEMAKAQSELAKGAEESARGRLEEVVDSNVESSAAALVALIETRVERGSAVSPEQAELVAAFAFEKRNEPIVRQLHAAHIRALAASGSFDLAQRIYAKRIGQLDAFTAAAVRNDVIGYLVRDADDIKFLRLTLSNGFDHSEQSSPKLANAVAARLLRHGFPRQAAALIGADVPPNSDVFRERRLLRGEVSLALDRPRQALVELLDLDGPGANIMRARALTAAGDHDAAFTLFDAANAEEDASVSALLSGAWPQDGNVESSAAAPESNDSDPFVAATSVDPGPPILVSRHALIEASTRARAAIEQLLANYPDPEPVLP